MPLRDLKNFNNEIVKSQKLIEYVKNAGGDVFKLVKYANELGYDFTLEEIQAAYNAQESATGTEADEKARALIGAAVCVGSVVGPPVVVSAAVAV